MISFLKGRLVSREPTFAVVDVNGIGYQVSISLHTFGEIKDQEEIMLHTYLHVREDAHILYGFSNVSEKWMFQNLIGVNGVGPSTAIVVLSYLAADELHTAIVQENVSVLQSVKGIGGKTAQRIILELKDKLRKGAPGVATIAGSKHNTIRQEALTALVTLGIGKAAAERSIDAVLKNAGNTISLEELVKLALKNA